MNHVQWRWGCAVVLAFGLLAGGGPAPGAVTPQQVQDAIDKGKQFLYEQQKDGNWEGQIDVVDADKRAAAAKAGRPAPNPSSPAQVTGWTALPTYALLAAGEKPQDQRIQNAVDFMLKTDTEGVYALGLRLNVWNLMPKTPQILKVLTKDANLLRGGMKNAAPAKGMYHYTATFKGATFDHSVSQYAVLGLWAAAQSGVELDRGRWADMNQAWREHQLGDGGWSYQWFPPGGNKPMKATTSMTAAGVASLFIFQDFLNPGQGIKCDGSVYDYDIEQGLEWIGRNFRTQQNPYTLYGIERIGVASGYKYLDGIDWYAEGAELLVKGQAKDGSWTDSNSPVVGTSFALLFLSRGRAPVVMNKLDYSSDAEFRLSPPAAKPAATAPKTASAASKPETARAARLQAAALQKAGRAEAVKNPWNQRPRDVANITRWMGQQVERDLNWQIVNLAAPASDLHDAPILYFAGNKELAFAPEHEQKLKRYVEDGGLILGNADCRSPAFADSFRALGEKLFPAYKFAPLPNGHVIYTNQQFNRGNWRRPPEVLSLGNGAREFMVLLPADDAAKVWQMQDPAQRVELFQFAANLFLYAVDKQGLRNKGETYLVEKDPKVKPTKTIKIARLIHGGNADPEPGGWRRLAAVFHNAHKTNLVVEPVRLGKESLHGHTIAHLTGTGKFALDDRARAEIRAFVDGGGTLVVDAAGGDGQFANDAEAELGKIFPAADFGPLDPLAAGHPLYAAGGTKLGDVGYRDWARANLGGNADAPRLRAIVKGGRAAVVYSREDLSVGLVGQPVDGILGYDPESATTLMTKALQYAASQGGKPVAAGR